MLLHLELVTYSSERRSLEMAEQEYDACFRDCEMSKTFTSQQMMELSANVSWKMAGPPMTDIVCKNPWFFYNTHVRSISDGKQPTYITSVISIYLPCTSAQESGIVMWHRGQNKIKQANNITLRKHQGRGAFDPSQILIETSFWMKPFTTCCPIWITNMNVRKLKFSLGSDTPSWHVGLVLTHRLHC